MASLLLSKTFDLSKQKTISTEAQLRQAAKEALEADALLRWRRKEKQPCTGPPHRKKARTMH
jgi:hypothetical protein